ncbi:MAG: thioredoxin domain-containing protein [Bacteroidota bacterium]
MDNVLLNALTTYLKAENIKVPKSELELQLFSHPYTPSLYAIKETLDFLKIENIAAQIATSQLNLLPKHFIAFIEDGEKVPHFSHVQRKGSQLYLHGDKQVINQNEFIKKWNGVVLLAEKDEKTTIPSSGIKYTYLFLIAFLGLSALLLLPDIVSFLFCITGSFGLYISDEIFKTTYTENSFLGEKVCGKNEDKGCAKILRSFGNIGLFSINDFLFAFLSSTIVLTLFNTQIGGVHTLAYATAIIAVISSLIFQGLFLKEWCRLCLLSSFIILIQTLLILWNGYYLEPPLLNDLLVLAFVFLIVLTIVHRFRSLKKQNNELSVSGIELLRFKRSPQTIERALKDTKSIKITSGASPLIFGNPDAKQVVLLVLSTTCSFCKKAFDNFYDVSKKGSSKYRFELVFNHYDTSSSARNDVTAAMIRSYYKKGPDSFLKMMDEWFEHMDVDKFLRETAVDFEKKDYGILQKQREWCSKNELFHTPILIINNRIIPHEYDASFLEDILGVMQENLEA